MNKNREIKMVDVLQEETNPEKRPLKKVFHPFKCRLNETAAIETNSSTDLTQVGFACFTIGMHTIFRPSFFLLVLLIPRANVYHIWTVHFKRYALIISYSWFVMVVFVFFVLGIIPLLGSYIKKRGVLLIHPWAMMLLYFDFVVWLTITVLFHIDILTAETSLRNAIRQVEQPNLVFAFIYVDIIIYFIVYYVYATYYIVAELTIIEKFY